MDTRPEYRDCHLEVNLISTVTYPALGAVAAPKVTNTFDAKGRLTKVTDWNNKAFTFGYDEASNPVSVAYPNGWSEANTFDGGNRLTKITQTNTALGLSNSYSYSLDNRSRAIQATTSLNGVSSTDTYTYDTRSRLATWNAQAYSFDAQGNLTGGPNLGSFAYDQGGQLCNSSKTGTASCVTPPGDATSYGFDQRGNRVSVTPTGTPTQTWAFNQRDQLVASPDGATYRYDGEGLRTSLTTGATTTRFTWDRSSGLPLLLSDGANAYVYGPSGAPLEQISATNTTTYLHTDRLRSVRALSDSTGKVTATRTYDPYGNPTTTTGTYNTPFGYAGEYTDANTGLIYLRARYYQPSSGQFINEDPAVSQTKQPYLYANGDPINRTDPSGLDPYTFTFDVGQGPPEDIAAFTHANCSSVFPIRGCKDNFAVGDVLSLKGFGQSFPVRVESISTASWTFVALQGHPEGAGRKITFDFSYDTQKNTTKLTTSTSTEGSCLTTWPAKTINFRIAKRTWRSLAENIRTSYQVTRARVIASSISAATAKYWVG